LTESSELDADQRPQTRWAMEPTLREVLLIGSVTAFFFVATLLLFRPFLVTARGTGDAGSYVAIAFAIRHWSFQGLVVKAFWGLSYLMACVSIVTRISDLGAYLVVSYVAGVSAIVLAYRLWGGWVAAFFTVLSLDWMQRLYLGGSESLFTALLFGSFLAIRRERWVLAAFLASLSTIVRPLGLLALVALGLTLLWKKEYRSLAKATLVGMTVGGLYAIPLVLYFQSPMANVRSYQNGDWQGGRLLGWPFYAFLQSTFNGQPPLTNLALTWGWILFALAGLLALLMAQRNRNYCRTYPVEALFTLAYLFFLYTYNSPQWSRGDFPRFVILVIPVILLALQGWLPKDRRLVWGLAVVSSVLAACSAVGIRNVAGTLRNAIQ